MVPVSFSRGDALLFGGDDVEGHDRSDGAVHGHGDGHLVERNFVEENFHVFDAVDGDAGLSDVAGDARVVGIITAVRGEVESDAESLLAGGEIAAIEGVGSSAVEKPAYWRTVHGRNAYMEAYGPRRNGGKPAG